MMRAQGKLRFAPNRWPALFVTVRRTACFIDKFRVSGFELRVFEGAFRQHETRNWKLATLLRIKADRLRLDSQSRTVAAEES